MKILATAKRNKKYLWEKTFEKCAIVAALENDHITFLEYCNNHVNTLSEERVKSLFPKEINLEIEVPIRECPFLSEENADFFAILNRKQEQYKTRFLEIITRTSI
jgi:hydrogenase maturation factor